MNSKPDGLMADEQASKTPTTTQAVTTHATTTQGSAAKASNVRWLVAVCTLNEAENILPLLQGIRRAMPGADVVVIDDDSADETAQKVESLARDESAVRLVVRDQRGLGGAIRHAMQMAIDEDFDFFLNLDGDFSHDPADLPLLASRIQNPPDPLPGDSSAGAISQRPIDVVIGSRYVDGGQIVGWPLHRKLMSRTVNRFATLCLRLPVADCSGSMRCYRVSALRSIDIRTLRSNGYAVLEEILVRLARQGSRMSEVPITFTDRTHGQSKLTVREALRSTAQMLAMAVQR